MYAVFTCVGLSFDRQRFYLGTVMLCVMAMLMACANAQPKEKRPLYVEALSDFVYVGSGPYDVQSVPAHEMKELPLPSSFKAGYQYVFHLKSSGQDADIYKRLLTRLQSKDIKITSANGDVHRYMGGPGFRIAFQGADFKGFIFNTLDGQILNNPALVKEWSLDDYILVLEET
jgi:hypothetical protein